MAAESHPIEVVEHLVAERRVDLIVQILQRRLQREPELRLAVDLVVPSAAMAGLYLGGGVAVIRMGGSARRELLCGRPQWLARRVARTGGPARRELLCGRPQRERRVACLPARGARVARAHLGGPARSGKGLIAC